MLMKEIKDKVELRYLVLEDAYTSVIWRNNPKIWELTLNSPNKKITIEDELNWIKKVIAENDSNRFAILFNNKYVGNIQLTNIKNNESYYGVFIGETDYWSRGIAKKATLLIIEFAFIELKLKKVKLKVRVEHINAYNLYLKIGFKEIDRDEKLIYMEISRPSII